MSRSAGTRDGKHCSPGAPVFSCFGHHFRQLRVANEGFPGSTLVAHEFMGLFAPCPPQSECPEGSVLAIRARQNPENPSFVT